MKDLYLLTSHRISSKGIIDMSHIVIDALSKGWLLEAWLTLTVGKEVSNPIGSKVFNTS